MTILNDLDIEYRVSPRRRSIGIQVTNEGRVVVSLPRGTSQAHLSQALEKHRAWIAAKVAERRAAWSRLQDGQAYFLGQPHRLIVLPSSKEPVTLHGQEIRVPLSPGQTDPWPPLRTWYAERALRLLAERVRHYASLMRARPGPVELKEWKRRWGECHPDGKLRFNWRLIMCPPEVIDYVVVHELAHLAVAGHNPRFWTHVAKVIPDYASRRQWLNRDGAPFLLWRL